MSRYFFSFPTTKRSLGISDQIFGILIDTLAINRDEKYELKVVVSELFANAYQHGNKGDESKYIDVIIESDEVDFAVTVADEGKGVAIETFQSFASEPSGPTHEHGRGVNIVHRFSDKVDVFRDSQGKFCIRAARVLERGTRKIHPAKIKP